MDASEAPTNRKLQFRLASLLGAFACAIVFVEGFEMALNGPASRASGTIATAIVASILAGTIPVGLLVSRERERDRAWRKNVLAGAEALGLRPVGSAKVAGRIGRFAVIATRDEAEGTSIVVDGVTSTTTILRGRAPDGTGIGDDAFDAKLHVTGDRATALVCLNTETRRALLDAAHVFDELRVEGGRIRARFRAGVRLALAVETLLHELVALAEALSPSRAGPRELAARFNVEPLATVRLQILEAALAGFEDSATPAARAALVDDDARVRLRAAEYLHDGPTLTRLAEDPAMPADVRTQAIDVASRVCEREDFLSLLSRLFAAQARTPRAPDAVLLALCGWARKTHSRHAQPALLAMLDGGAAVRDAAILGLAAVGDVEAVAPLRAIASGLFAGETGRAAENAVAAIQARLKGAGPGQVSLPDASSSAGALSEPESAGNLSIAKTRTPSPQSTRRR